MKTKTFKAFKKTYPNIKFEHNAANNQLTIIGHFNTISDIKRTFCGNSDYATINKRHDGLFSLNTLLTY